MKHKIDIFILLFLTIISTGIPAVSETSSYDQLVKVVNTDGDETSCTFSADRKILIFTRKAQDAKSFDLYITELKNGSWSTPAPLTELNTDSDEISPFISEDGNYLIFSSNRKESLKNQKASKPSFDLYVSEKDGQKWGIPSPVFGAINTTDDETSPFITPDGNMIYFTRTKFNNIKESTIIQAEKDNDIWGVNMQNSDISYITFLRTYMIKLSEKMPGFWVSAYEENSDKRDIFFIKVDSEGNSEVINPGETINTINDENSIFEISDKLLMISADNGISGSYDIEVKQIPDGIIPADESEITAEKKQADKIKPGDLTKKTDTKKKGKKDTVAKKEKKKKSTKEKSVSTADEDSIFVVDVKSGNVDDVQNIPLKVLLFDSLKSWSNPIASTVVSPDGNNKIEIKTSANIKRIVIIPEDDSVDGFAEEYIINRHGIMTGSLKLAKTEEKEFKIRPVYFSFNSCEVQLQDIPYLHDLLEYMRKNSDLKITIEGYSDSHGTARANLEISVKRAEKVRDYLVKMGIDSSRITTRGHGFVSKKTEGTSQQKRRVDFIIVE